MKFAVIGPTGFGGSHVCVELLNREQDVVGISRNPEKLGQHQRYSPVKLDVATAPIKQIVDTFKDMDVLIDAYNPPPGPTMYRKSTYELIFHAFHIDNGQELLLKRPARSLLQ